MVGLIEKHAMLIGGRTGMPRPFAVGVYADEAGKGHAGGKIHTRLNNIPVSTRMGQ